MHSSFTALRNTWPMNVPKTLPKHGQDTYATNSELKNDVSRINEIFNVSRQRVLDDKVNGEFLCGQFSMADCMFAPVIFRFRTYETKFELLTGHARTYALMMMEIEEMKEWAKCANAEGAETKIDDYETIKS